MILKMTSLLLALSFFSGFATQSYAERQANEIAEKEMMMKKDRMIDHARNHHKIISVTSAGLIPRTAEFREDDAIAWLNYLPETAEISFDNAVGKNLMCASPGLFRAKEGRLSASLDELGFASLCHLRAGEYDYSVTVNSSERSREKFAGKLVIE